GLEGHSQSRIGAGVERREAVIEEVDRRPLHDGARDREPLALPTRHIGPTLVDRRLELAGHRRNEVPSLRDLERTPKLRVGGALVAEAEVLRDRALEEICGLRNEPDACPEPIERLLAHVEAVD